MLTKQQKNTTFDPAPPRKTRLKKKRPSGSMVENTSTICALFRVLSGGESWRRRQLWGAIWPQSGQISGPLRGRARNEGPDAVKFARSISSHRIKWGWAMKAIDDIRINKRRESDLCRPSMSETNFISRSAREKRSWTKRGPRFAGKLGQNILGWGWGWGWWLGWGARSAILKTRWGWGNWGWGHR